jgi:hypothetical protein
MAKACRELSVHGRRRGPAIALLRHEMRCLYFSLPLKGGGKQRLRPLLKNERNRVYPISVGEGTDTSAKFINAVRMVGRTLEHGGYRIDDSVGIAAISAPT